MVTFYYPIANNIISNRKVYTMIIQTKNLEINEIPVLKLRSEKIPFSGEPLKGLQVMGVLETRNLDFKNVFILSLNEGAFPSKLNKGGEP